MARGARGPDPPDQGEDQILGPHARPGSADEARLHGARAADQNGLGGEDVLHVAGADAKGQSAEGPVSRGVGVAADDDRAGLSQSQLRTDHVHDSLPWRVEIEQLDAEVAGVLQQELDLPAGDGIGDGSAAIDRSGHVVVNRGHRQVGSTHPPTRQPQALERLR